MWTETRRLKNHHKQQDKKMKTKLFLLGVALFATVTSIHAQSVTNAPAGAQPFIAQLGQWATSYDTTKSWTNCISLDTGIATTTGSSIADRIQIKKNTGNFAYGLRGDFTGVGSAFNQSEVVGDWYLANKYDFKFGVTVGAGYNFNISTATQKNCFVFEPGFTMSKLITANTYATMSYTLPVQTVGKFNNISTIYVGAGFTF